MVQKFDFLPWNYGKEIYNITQEIFVNQNYCLIDELQMHLDRINMKDLTLLDFQPKNAYYRSLVEKAQVDGIHIDLTTNDSMIYPSKLQIDTALDLSDYFNLNELTALDYVLSAEYQYNYFPPNFETIYIAALLLMDSALYITLSIKSILIFLIKVSKKLNENVHINDDVFKIYHLLQNCCEQLFFCGNFVENTIKNNVYLKIDIDQILESMRKKGTNILPPNFKRQIRQAHFNAVATITSCFHILCTSKRSHIMDIKALIHYIKYNAKQILVSTKSQLYSNLSEEYLKKFYSFITSDLVSLMISLSFISAVDQSLENNNTNSNQSTHWMLKTTSAINPIIDIHNTLICNPEEKWADEGLKNCFLFAWAIFLRVLKQNGQVDLKTTMPDVLDIDEEDILDKCIMNHVFTSLKCLVVLNPFISSLGHNTYLMCVDNLIANMLMHFPWKIKELKNDSDDSARLLADTETEDIMPYSEIPQYLEELFLLMADIFAVGKECNMDLALKYWSTTPAQLRIQGAEKETSKMVNLYKFVTILCDSNVTVYPSQFFPYLKMLISMASGSPECANNIFKILCDSSPNSSTISWDHFLITLRKYIQALGGDLSEQIRNPVSLYDPGQELLPMSEFEIEGMILALKLLEEVVKNDPGGRIYFLEWKRGDTSIEHPLRLLVASLSPISIPLHLKAQIMDTITAFVTPYKNFDFNTIDQLFSVSVLICNLLKSSNLLIDERSHTDSNKIAPFYFKLILEEIESTRLEQYPLTISFLKFLLTIWFPASLDPNLNYDLSYLNIINGLMSMTNSTNETLNLSGSGLNAPIKLKNTLTIYLTYICESIFIPLFSRNYKIPMERWIVASLCLKIFEATLDSSYMICQALSSDTSLKGGLLNDTIQFMAPPLAYILSLFVTDGPFSQIIFYILNRGITVLDGIGLKISQPFENAAQQTSPSKKVDQSMVQEEIDAFILTQCCAPLLRTFALLIQNWSHYVDALSVGDKYWPALNLSHNSLCDTIVLPHLDTFLSYVCHNDLCLTPMIAAKNQISFPSHALLSTLILTRLNHDKVESFKLTQQLEYLIVKSQKTEESKRFIKYGISKYLNSIPNVDNETDTTTPKPSTELKLTPFRNVFNAFQQLSKTTSNEASEMMSLSVLHMLYGYDQKEELSQFSLFILGLNVSPDDYLTENSHQTTFNVLLDLTQNSTWLLDIDYSSPSQIERNTLFAPSLYAMFYKLSTQAKLFESMLTYMRTQEIVVVQDEARPDDSSLSGKILPHNHFTLHLNSAYLYHKSISSLNTITHLNWDTKINWASSIYLRVAYFFKYFAIEIRQCLNNSLASFLARYTKLLFSPQSSDSEKTCNMVEFFNLLFIDEVPALPNVMAKDQPTFVQQLLLKIDNTCTTTNNLGFTYYDMDMVQFILQSHYFLTDESNFDQKYLDEILNYILGLNVYKLWLFAKKAYLHAWNNLVRLMTHVLLNPLYISGSEKASFDNLTLYTNICHCLFLKATASDFCKELAHPFTDLLLSCTTFVEKCYKEELRIAIDASNFYQSVAPFNPIHTWHNLLPPKMYEEILTNTISLFEDSIFSSAKCQLNLYAVLIQCFSLALKAYIPNIRSDFKNYPPEFTSNNKIAIEKFRAYAHKYLQTTVQLLSDHLLNLFDTLTNAAQTTSSNLLQIYSYTLQNCISHFEFYTSHAWVGLLIKKGYFPELIQLSIYDAQLRNSLQPRPDDINVLYVFASKMKYLETLAMSKIGANALIDAGLFRHLRDMDSLNLRYELCVFENQAGFGSSIKRYNMSDGKSRYVEYILMPTLRLIKTLLCTMGTKNIKICLQVINFWQKHQESLIFSIKLDQEFYRSKVNILDYGENTYHATNQLNYLNEMELITCILAICQTTLSSANVDDLKTVELSLRGIMNTKTDIKAFNDCSKGVMNLVLVRFFTTKKNAMGIQALRKPPSREFDVQEQAIVDCIIINTLRYYEGALQSIRNRGDAADQKLLTSINGVILLEKLPDVLNQLITMLNETKLLFANINALESDDEHIIDISFQRKVSTMQDQSLSSQENITHKMLKVLKRISQYKNILQSLILIILVMIKDINVNKHENQESCTEFLSAQKLILKQEPNIPKLQEILKRFQNTGYLKTYFAASHLSNLQDDTCLETLLFNLQKLTSLHM